MLARLDASLRILAALTLVAAGACSSQYDVVLIGGRVMDPESGLDAMRNVGIRDGRIAVITERAISGDTTIDVTGLVVAPGFIDLHAHGQTTSDLTLKAQDGVTTALELEIGVFPVDSWYVRMEGTSPINYGASVSHLSARIDVFHGVTVMHWPTEPETAHALGDTPDGTNARANDEQREALAEAIRQGLQAGGLGVGFGINYTPGADQDEIRALFAVAAERDAPVFVHTRAFGIGAIQEAIVTAEEVGARLHIVHIGSSGGEDVPAVLAALDQARGRGLDVTTEVYPYTAASTLIESALFNPGWQRNLDLDYGDIAWAATGERLTRQSFATYRKQGGWVILYMMRDENVDRAVAEPDVIIASDGVPFMAGTGHPRGAGTYARVLGHYVRERRVLPLMEALAKMTILPARRLETVAPAMRRKGRLSEGADADITVFDPETVLDRATFEQPTLPSAGIPFVIVGGTFVVRDGRVVRGSMPGQPVRGRTG